MRRRKSNFSIEEYKKLISEVNWYQVYSTTNPDLAYYHFETSLLQILDKLAPMKPIQISSRRKTWVSQKSKDMMEIRDQARMKAKTTQDPNDWKHFRDIKNKCIKNLRLDKSEHYKNKYE